MSRFHLFCLAATLAALTGCSGQMQRYEFSRPQMGTLVRLVFYAPDQSTATAASNAAFARIDQLNQSLSDYLPDSELNRLSASAGSGRAIPVSQDLWSVLATSQRVSRLTNGAFDVTVGPVERLWRQARRASRLPEPDRLADARKAVGYEHVHLDPATHSVTLGVDHMRLDLGGIAKGYAGDQAMKVLRKYHIDSALIDAGGDLILSDPPPDRDAWRVALLPIPNQPPAEQSGAEAEAPAEAAPPPTNTPTYLHLTHTTVATSGDAWQHVTIDGVRYSHIVDPATGMGLTNQISATVIDPDGAETDALATALCVLGPQRGMALINSIPHAAAMIVHNDHGVITTYYSANFPTRITPPKPKPAEKPKPDQTDKKTDTDKTTK